MSIADPSENAYFFIITDSNGKDFEAFIDINDIDSELSVWDCRYRKMGTQPWSFLSASLHPEPNGFDPAIPLSAYQNATREKAVAEMFRMVDGYTAIIKKEFGLPNAGAGSEPLPSLELLKWFLKNKVIEIDNTITFVG